MDIVNQNLIELPARSGCAIYLDQGMELQIINTHGNQVVDTWALNAKNPDEHMSMSFSPPVRWM